MRDFVERGGRAGRVGGGFASAEDTLAKLDLVAPDGSLRNAAVELFCEGSDSYPRMKLGLLGGNTKAKILDLRRECGTMLKLLDFAEYFVTSNIRREFVIGETGMYRKEIPEIPAEAIREAVANALCHRDYATGTAVEVNVFMDTVQIVSPGLFPEGDSPERHLDGVASEFGLRNPAIARTLFRAGVIEQYGTGIPRIKEACEAAGVLVCLAAAGAIGGASFAGMGPDALLGCAFAFLAAFGWGFEGCVAGFGTALVDYRIGIAIRQLTAGLLELVVAFLALAAIGGDVALVPGMLATAAIDPSILAFAVSGLFAMPAFSFWCKGNSMCGTALGMACNGMYAFWGPLFIWLLMGALNVGGMSENYPPLTAVQWIGAVAMVAGIFLIAVNPASILKRKED